MKVKGTVLLSRAAFVRKHFGEDGWKKVLAELPAADAAAVTRPLSGAWYAVEAGKRLDDAIFRVLGKGDPAVFEALGAASARENLSTVHKTFITHETPRSFMEKAPMIYGFYYDTGRRTYEATGPESCVVTTHEAEAPSCVDCLTVIGWYKEALAMCGATDVQASEEVCRAAGGPHCRYVFRWKYDG